MTRLLLFEEKSFLLFFTFSVLVVNPKKTTLHGGQSRSWSAEQVEEKKRRKNKVWHDRAGLRVYVQFNKHTHIHLGRINASGME